MGKTSTDAKRRYNEKTYTRWTVDLKNDDFQKIESMRGEMSRAQFLKMLISHYENR